MLSPSFLEEGGGGGVEPGALGAGAGVDTLLGFEGSDILGPPRTVLARVVGVAVVGVLFVNWIVDASICGSCAPLSFGGRAVTF